MTRYQMNQVWELQQALTEEFENKEKPLSLRTAPMMGGDRQAFYRNNERFFIATLEDHLFDHTQPVVFTIQVDEGAFLLRFCCPIRPEEHQRLSALNYAPPLRSKWYLTVGVNPGGYAYAYSAIKLTPHSSVLDLFDALHVLGRELEVFMKMGEDEEDEIVEA